MQNISLAVNLEYIGDKNLMDLAVKKIKHRHEFSKEGATELAPSRCAARPQARRGAMAAWVVMA